MTVSSAWRRISNFKYKFNSIVCISRSSVSTPPDKRKDSRSLRYKANNMGDRFSPCRTPHWLAKKVDAMLLALTHDFMFSYILVTTQKNFPSIRLKWSLRHSNSPFLQIESKACEKSMNAQKSFCFRCFSISHKELRTNMWSVVSYLFLKPAWFSCNISLSSKNFVRRRLSTDVKSFPKQLNIVIGL